MTFFILTSLLSCNKIIDNPKPISNNNRNNHKINKRDQNKVIGIWKIHGEENSTFQIYKDSIYYTDKGQIYKYKTVKDSFYIYYDVQKVRPPAIPFSHLMKYISGRTG